MSSATCRCAARTGKWYSMNPMLVESTPQYTLWCCGWSTADVPDMKNTWVDWRVMCWDYYQWPPVEYTEQETWGRYNTVVQWVGQKVLKWDPGDEANCDTNALFTIDHLNYGNPDWKVTVKIYDAAGGLIRTLVQEGGFQVGENAVEWDGSLEPPPYGPGGQAPKGLYTYTVEAVHTEGSPYWPNEMCKDKDKAPSPTLAITGVSKVHFDRETMTLTLDVSYQVTNGYADDGEIRIYDNSFAQVGETREIEDDPQTGHVPAGDTERFELTLEPEQFGLFSAAFSARQTAEAGAANRDGQAKAARQGLGTIEERPWSKNWRGTDWEWGENLVQYQETVHREKRYQAYATVGMPDDNMLESAFYSSALILLENHAGPGYMEIGDAGWVVGRQYNGFQPDTMLALRDLLPAYSDCVHFVAFVGCKTAQNGGQYGCLTDDAVAAGANAALGFREIIYTGEYSRLWVPWFYYYACVYGSWVTYAADWAAEKVKEEKGQYGGVQ